LLISVFFIKKDLKKGLARYNAQELGETAPVEASAAIKTIFKRKDQF
jgi:hypothetical protein